MSTEDFIREKFNSGAELEYATRRLTVSSITDKCDFLKIDTDGFDLKALHGAEALFQRAPPIVIQCEAHFNGDPTAGDSSVSGIADLLQRRGYTWLDITVVRYRRSALPERFLYGIPACTERGPVGFCDLLFVDDPLSEKGKLSRWLNEGLGRCYKLLALYDVLGFPDCAAELIVALSRHPTSASADDWASLLNIIEPNHAELIQSFRADYTRFL
ncbi:hypothetical protein GC169_09570 [bacterium]|nr:hypothetical protein [bacterium]